MKTQRSMTYVSDSRQIKLTRRELLLLPSTHRPHLKPLYESTGNPVVSVKHAVNDSLTNKTMNDHYIVHNKRSSPPAKQITKKKLALLIAAYNEEDVIEHTLRSAIRAGMDPRDIYVVDDKSADCTAERARTVIGRHNVVTVQRSGKGLAIHRGSRQKRLISRYEWIHVADADGEFSEKYFTELKEKLDDSYAAATGYITSLPGSIIGQYRVFEYTLGMEIVRRFQSMAKVITIIPGPTSCFRSDVFEKLNFHANALCEDFDVTLQIHRQKLGGIQFIPTAISRTQDPATFKDFYKQITRWNRGVVQMLFKHKIGTRASRVDAYLMYQIMQNMTFFAMYGLWVPLLTLYTGSLAYLSIIILSDIILTAGFTVFAASRSRRWDILNAFPIIYALRWVNLFVFIKSFVEVGLLRKYRLTAGVWETMKRQATS